MFWAGKGKWSTHHREIAEALIASRSAISNLKPFNLHILKPQLIRTTRRPTSRQVKLCHNSRIDLMALIIRQVTLSLRRTRPHQGVTTIYYGSPASQGNTMAAFAIFIRLDITRAVSTQSFLSPPKSQMQNLMDLTVRSENGAEWIYR